MRALLRTQLFLVLAAIASPVLISSCGDSSTGLELSELDRNKQIAEAYVHSYAVAIGEAVLEMDSDSIKIAFIRRAIDSFVFYPDSSGYFYVYDYDCVNIAHGTQQDLQDQNLIDFQDSRGTYVIRELSAMAQSGGGYVEYWWIKPGETGEKKKLGYVEPIPNTNYFIGSGVYLE